MADFASGAQDKSVLITGAGRGIGKRLAIGFAAAGARVALLARSASELDLARMEIEHAGGRTLAITADVCRAEQLACAAQRIYAEWGGPDIVICAAGILGPIGAFTASSPGAWDEAVQTNLIGVANTCRAVLPKMIAARSGKVLVLVGGGSGAPRPFLTAHAASKAAVVRFIESLAEEVGHHNIQLNCLDPGQSYTSMTDEILRAGADAGTRETEEARLVRITGGTPPEKQLQLALFLTSSQSNHINGKLLLASDEPKRLQHLNMLPELFTLRRFAKS